MARKATKAAAKTSAKTNTKPATKSSAKAAAKAVAADKKNAGKNISKNRIKELRLEKGYSQVELAVLTGVQQESISAYEKGKNYPNMDVLMRMADLFDVTIDYIVYHSNVRRLMSVPKGFDYDIEYLIETWSQIPKGKRKILKDLLEALKD